ncbi:FAD/NAD(P)-binding domain-containing protein [Rhizoclosmatium globosum]|uniref:FAD/NAD(P)-binding domain-containing protein n=1 Tax=Rhizoclosmatium globosum TaxID=329046 RepID=A0A1Y2BXF4_9FUNG|nr:FAD/NAD(P)-binding domain-containing protein [Rhizoclosmatium globosum]|eukprot:ORY39426.1 FAD/NAD(P)-binding domain-containing protein [Rhizoclosmatium globosum]
MKVIIVGTGLAGTAAALAIRKAGHESILFDKIDLVEAVQKSNGGPVSLEFGEVGAGVVIQTNGLRVLKRLGLLDQVIAAGFTDTDYMHLKQMDGGKPIKAQIGAQDPDPRLRHSVQLLRSKLHTILLKECQTVGVKVYTGKKVEKISDVVGNHVQCQFADGTTVEGDLIVGADGIHSMTRRLVYGEDSKAQFTGIMGYLGVTQLTGDLQFGESLTMNTDRVNKREITMCRLGDDKIGWTVTEFSEPRDDVSDTWRPYSNLPKESARLSELVLSWGAPKNLSDIVASAKSITPVAIYDLPDLPSFHKGRVALIGDAAHGMRPNRGQGCNQAFEDAIVLADALEAFSDAKDISKALLVYDRVRMERAQKIAEEARVLSARTFADTPFQANIAHLVTRIVLNVGNWTNGGGWITQYDTTEDTYKAIEAVKRS